MTKLSLQIFVAFLLLLVPLVGFCQAIDARSITDSNFSFVTKNFEVLEVESVVPIDSVILPEVQKRFKPVSDTSVKFHRYDQFYNWFRFVVSNPQNTTREVMLCMGPTGMKEAELYQRSGAQWKSLGKTGKSIPFHLRPYRYAHFVFPLQLAPNKIDTFYLHVNNRHYFKIYAFALVHPKALKVFQNKVYFLFGIIVGILILFCLFNFYLFFSTKEKVHFWYAVYVLAVLVFVLKNDSLDEEFIGFDTPSSYRIFSVSFFGALPIGILTHVIQVLFTNIHRTSWLYILTRIVKWNLFVSALVHLVVFYIEPSHTVEQFAIKWTLNSMLLANILIFWNCVYSIYKGNRSGYFILVGLAVFLVGALKRLLLLPDESYLKPPYIFHIGIICEAIIISFGLIYRTNLERLQRRRYLKEKQIMEREFEKKLLESKFEIQEQTLKNISANLHHNIGKSLASITLRLKSIKNLGRETDEKIESACELVEKASTDIDNLSKSFLSDPVTKDGLFHAIQYELELIRKTRMFLIEFVSHGQPIRIHPQKEFIMFRIFQEAINNIVKHAQASQISVALAFLSDQIKLEIKDNGIGFNSERSAQQGIEEYGSGLHNMSNRAKSIGGMLTIQNNLEKGACITVILPMNFKKD